MTEAAFRRKQYKLKKRIERWKKLSELKETELKYKQLYKPKKETSKLFAVYLMGIFNVILVYAMVAMWHFSDLACLGTLVGDIAAQVLTYKIYCDKAYKGKNAEEANKLEKYKFDEALKARTTGFSEDDETETITEDEAIC